MFGSPFRRVARPHLKDSSFEKEPLLVQLHCSTDCDTIWASCEVLAGASLALVGCV
jgi:hypothetical protein